MIKKKAKGLSPFYRVFWSVAAALLLLLVIAVVLLRSFLANYEKALPKYAAKEVFEELFLSNDGYQKLGSEIHKTAGKFDGDTDFAAMASEILSGKELTYGEISDDFGDEKIGYAVRNDGHRLAIFTLKRSDKKLAGGYYQYVLDSVSLTKKAASLDITVPSGYELRVSGEKVDDGYISGEKTISAASEHLPAGVSPLEYVTYKIDGIYGTPQIEVFDKDGKECAVSKKDGAYIAAPNENEALKTKYSGYITAGAKAFATYMQSDASFNAVKPYLIAGTTFYTQTYYVENYFVIDHDSYSFDNVSASEFYEYDENTFSCRISFTHLLHRAGLEDYKDYFDTTFIMKKVGDGYRIYDAFNN